MGSQELSKGTVHQRVEAPRTCRIQAKVWVIYTFHFFKLCKFSKPTYCWRLESKFCKLGTRRRFVYVCIVHDKSVSNLCHLSLSEHQRDCRACWLPPMLLLPALGQARSCDTPAEWFLSPTLQRGSIRLPGTVWATLHSWDSAATYCPYLGWIAGFWASPWTFLPFNKFILTRYFFFPL